MNYDDILCGNGIVNRNPINSLNLRNEAFQYGRIALGQIKTINKRTGVAQVLLPFLGEIKDCHIKMDAFNANNFRSSWIRAMPQVNSMVLVFFDHSNNGFIIGSSMFYNDNDTVVDNPVNKMYYNLTRSKEREEDRNVDWRILEEGELDGRSSGGCYYHMSSEGIYTILSGKTIMKIIRDRNELSVDADLLRSLSSFSTFRFGDVKRKTTPNDLTDSTVVNDSVLNHEFSYRLRGRAPTEAAAPRIFSFRSGNVYNWNNKTIASSDRGSPVRLKIESYRGTDSTTPPTFDLQVDASGNVALNTDQAGTLLSINTGEVNVTNSLDFTINSTGQISVTTAQSASLTSTSNFSITSGGTFTMRSTGSATIQAPTVAIGAPTQSGGVVLGPGLAAAMTAAAAAFTAAGGTLATSAGSLAASVTAASSSGLPPSPVSNLVFITQITALLQQFAATQTANGTALNTMATTTAASPATSATVTASA